jgi:hypothetical protein
MRVAPLAKSSLEGLAHAADRRLKVERLWAFENLSRAGKVLQFIGLKLEAEQPIDDAVESLQKIRRHESPSRNRS